MEYLLGFWSICPLLMQGKDPQVRERCTIGPKFCEMLITRLCYISGGTRHQKNHLDGFTSPKTRTSIQSTTGLVVELICHYFWLPVAKLALQVLDFSYFLVDLNWKILLGFSYFWISQSFLWDWLVPLSETIGYVWPSIGLWHGQHVHSLVEMMLDGMQAVAR